MQAGRWQGSRAGEEGIWGTRDCSCTRPGCSEPSLPQEPFRKQRAGSFLRCRISPHGQLSSFQQALGPPLLCHRPSLPSSAFRGIVQEGKLWESLFLLLLHLPSRQVGSCSLVLAAPYLTGGKAKHTALAGECSSRVGHRFNQHLRIWGAETHIALPAVTEEGVGLLLTTLTSLSKETCEPLVEAVTVLRDTRLPGWCGESHLNLEL